MLLKEAIADYLLYLEHERSASRETIRTYRPSLRRFLEWVEENGHPVPTIRDITTPRGRRYLYHLSERGLRPRSRLRLWIPIRSLFRMLVEHGALSASPVETIALPKKDPAERLLVSDAELLQVLEAAGRQRCAWRAARDQAVLAVLIYTGLRRAEVLDLGLTDVNVNQCALQVRHGKGNKARMVPLCEEAKAYVARWLELRPSVQHDYLFVTDEVRRLAENGLRALLDRAKTVAGLPNAENIKPHSIRHAAATRLVRNGADLRSVMAWLGHSHLQTTAIYLHSDDQRLQAIAQLASIQPAASPAAAPVGEASACQTRLMTRRLTRSDHRRRTA
jgi:site-specific recombinase XerD